MLKSVLWQNFKIYSRNKVVEKCNVLITLKLKTFKACLFGTEKWNLFLFSFLQTMHVDGWMYALFKGAFT